jgi:putative NADH-flavin reductase
VTALARNAESLATINDLRLRIVEGDVLDKEKVDEIVKG